VANETTTPYIPALTFGDVSHRMCNMKSVTVREVRQQFSSKVEGPLRRGETLVLRKRAEILGRIVPELAKVETYPDFAARQNKIFGSRTIHLNVGEILRRERSRL
jgi:hypothetical protein